MGLFYKVPNELQQLEGMVLACGGEMAARAGGYGSAGLLEEMLPDTVALMQETRDRLVSAGRDRDLKAFRKHLLGVGRYMDNAPYNRAFLPFVNGNLKP